MTALLSSNPIEDTADHILIVDDDTRIRDLLTRYLSKEGYRVTSAASAENARSKLAGLSFDLLVLDVMMPGEDGFTLLSSLKETLDVPVLMLTAKSDTEDRVHGLELGADDYLGKPFEPRELLLRIQKLLARHTSAPIEPVQEVRFGPFVFHRSRRELKCGDEIVRLTERERELLVAFSETPGETVPRYSLIEDDGSGASRTIDVQITRLRRKIEDDPANPIYLQTVRGVGYRLVPD